MDASTHTTARLLAHPRLLRGIQVVWLVLVAVGLILFALGTVRYYDSLRVSSRYVPYESLLQQLGLGMSHLAGWLVVFDVLLVVICTSLALLIFVRRSHDLQALLVSQTIFFIGFSFSFAISQLEPLIGAVVITFGFFFLIIPLNLFPSGTHIPRWTRWISILCVPYFIACIPLQLAALDVRDGAAVPSTYGLAVLGMLLIFGLAFLAQIMRYRTATRVQRQQTKFVVYGVAVALLFEVLTWLTAALPGTAHPYSAPDRAVYTQASLIAMLVAKPLDFLSLLSIPIGFAFAIQRTGLWEIDLVINRSLVYGAATGLVALVFAAVALLINVVLGAERTDLSLIIAVLLSVGLFNPARRQAQRFVDRRIYGLRFDLNQLMRQDKNARYDRQGVLSGQVLGSYRLHDIIGSGGMGEVYSADQNGQPYAVKVLMYASQPSAEARERFAREAEVTKRLNHPNIVTVYTYGEQERCFYMVMEMIVGIDLYHWIKQQGAVSLSEALPVLKRVGAALDYIHQQGLVHRDLKPANIMLNPEQDWFVKLLDFGIAKSSQTTSITGSGAVGTIDYMAPEQIRESRAVDHRADIYALAIMAYEMLSGLRPFTGSPAHVMFAHLQQPPPSLRISLPSMPASVDLALQRGMAKEAHERFNSAEAFVAALAAQ